MPVNIRVDAVFPGGFGPVKRESAAVDRELKQQIRERQRLLRLSAGLERDITREERAQVREVKEQIAQRRRLNQLSKSLDRDLAQGQSRQRGAAGIPGLGAAAVVAGVGAAAKTAIELAREADQAKKTEQAFVNLSGSVEKAAENQAAMERATRGLISEQEQQQIANQLLGMQLVDNADQLETLVGGARRLGKEFKGMNAEESASDFALLLSNMSYLRLDQFGLSAGKVRERVNELKDAGMGAEEAFRTAVFEEMEKTLARLGPEVVTTTEKLDAMAGKYADLRANAGDFVSTFLEFTGALDAGLSGLDGLNLGLEKASELFTALSNVDFTPDVSLEKLDKLAQGINSVFNSPVQASLETFKSLGEGKGLIDSLRDGYQAYGDALTDVTSAAIDLTTADDDMSAAAEKAAQGVQATTTATKNNTAATEENTEAQEEAARAAKKLADTREKAVREALDIEDKANADADEARQKFIDDALKAEQKYRSDLVKARQDLKKDLIKIDADTGRSVAKERQNADRQIKATEQQREKEQKFQRRREQIDAMADQRLFQYEIKQLGAEGDALAIQQARERRDIEQQAASERKDLDAEQEQSQFSDSQQRLRDSAAERIAEIKRAASEEKEAKKADLEESEAAEAESLAKRIEDLRTFRDDKLTEIDESRIEAIEALGRELAEAKDLTKTQLDELTPIIGQIGADAADAWADGFTAGIERNKQVQELLGLKDNDFTGRDFGKTSASGTPNTPGFATGGRPPVGLDVIVGEEGPELFRADRPGTIMPAAQTAAIMQGGGGLTVNMPAITINGGGGGVSERQVMALLERHRAAMMAELSEMLE